MRTVALAAVMALGGCNCGEVSLDIPSKTKTITVPGSGINIDPLVPDDIFPSDQIGELLGQEISNSLDTSGYKKEAVKSLKLTEMSVRTVGDDGGCPDYNLGFFQSLTMFIGKDEVKVAFSKDGAFDDNPNEYDFELTDAECNEQFQQSDNLDVTADVEVDDQPICDVDIQFKFVITAIVNAFQAL